MEKIKKIKKEKSKTEPHDREAKVKKRTKSSSIIKKAVNVQKEKYFEGIGRRKTAIARVRLFPQKEKSFSVNEKPSENYFPTIELQETILAPLSLTGCLEQFKASAKVKGGGTVSQAEAVRHGVARALVLFDSSFRKKLKSAGFLKRDPRMRERKKFGLKRARRAPQWSKR